MLLKKFLIVHAITYEKRSNIEYESVNEITIQVYNIPPLDKHNIFAVAHNLSSDNPANISPKNTHTACL